MKLRRAAGAAIVAAPFIALTMVMGWTDGWGQAAAVWGTTAILVVVSAAILAVVVAGLSLLMD